MNAPLLLFVYKRPEHTRLTVQALLANSLSSQTDLIVFSDAPRSEADAALVAEVRRYIRSVQGFKSIEVIEREENLGLARSIISGVSATLSTNNRVIVMEDDLVTSPNFLAFMNAALQTYEADSRIFSVTGLNFPIPVPTDYPHPVYLSHRSSSWGWGTWADRWAQVDWDVRDYDLFASDPAARAGFNRGGEDLADMLALQMAGKIDSWAIRWAYAHFVHSAWCLFAVRSKVQNIGCDSSGTHCGATGRYRIELDDSSEAPALPREITHDPRIIKNFARFHRYPLREKVRRLLLGRP